MEFVTEECLLKTPKGEKIVGLLEMHPSDHKNVAIICHGMLDHKNGGFRKAMAKSLPFRSVCVLYRAARLFTPPRLCSTFRHDFRGAGESEPVAPEQLPMHLYADYGADVEDLKVVHDYLVGRGLTVVAIIGHSRYQCSQQKHRP
jgi:hypothetical protein